MYLRPGFFECPLLLLRLLVRDELGGILVDGLLVAGPPGTVAEAVVGPLAGGPKLFALRCALLQLAAGYLLTDEEVGILPSLGLLRECAQEVLILGDVGENSQLLGAVVSLDYAPALRSLDARPKRGILEALDVPGLGDVLEGRPRVGAAPGDLGEEFHVRVEAPVLVVEVQPAARVALHIGELEVLIKSLGEEGTGILLEVRQARVLAQVREGRAGHEGIILLGEGKQGLLTTTA